MPGSGNIPFFTERKCLLEQILYPAYSECISLRSRPTLNIGSLYQSDIYYSYDDRIPERMAVLYFEGDELMFLKYPDNDSDEGSACIFQYETEIRLYGLVLLNLGDYLVVTSLYGDLRIARRREYAPY